MNAFVHGLGMVAPNGLTSTAELQALQSATASSLNRKVTIIGDEANPKDKRLPRLDRMILAAARQALEKAPHVDRSQMALVFGTGYGNLQSTVDFLEGAAQRGFSFASPTSFHQSVHHAPAGHLSIALGLKGISLTISNREISGEAALHLAVQLLATGRAESVLVVAGDERNAVLEAGFAAFSSQMNKEKTVAAIGEGAAAVVLSRLPSGVEVTDSILSSHPASGLHFPKDATKLLEQLSFFLKFPLQGVSPFGSLDAEEAIDEPMLRSVFASANIHRDYQRFGFHPSAGLLRVVAAALRTETEGPQFVHGLAMGGGQAAVVLRCA